MKIAFLAMGSLLMSVQPASSQDQKLTALVESSIRPQFDEAMKAAMKLLSTAKGGSERDKENAINAFKMMYYNKAYGIYSCTKSELAAAVSGRRGADEVTARIERCIEVRNLQAVKGAKMATDYGSIIGRSSALRCEMQARLFAAEVEFPSFEFLRGGGVFLYDFEKLSDCYLATVR